MGREAGKRVSREKAGEKVSGKGGRQEGKWGRREAGGRVSGEGGREGGRREGGGG